MSAPTSHRELPAGGAPLETADYLDFIDREYLAGYVARGGSAVKLMVTGNDVVARELADGLASIGDGFLHVAIDAAGVRVHMIDQIFGAVARQVDWLALADAVVRRAYERTGFPVPDKDDELEADGPVLSVTTLAAYHDVDPWRRTTTSIRRSCTAACAGCWSATSSTT